MFDFKVSKNINPIATSESYMRQRQRLSPPNKGHIKNKPISNSENLSSLILMYIVCETKKPEALQSVARTFIIIIIIIIIRHLLPSQKVVNEQHSLEN